jgi:hypothetical protein
MPTEDQVSRRYKKPIDPKLTRQQIENVPGN